MADFDIEAQSTRRDIDLGAAGAPDLTADETLRGAFDAAPLGMAITRVDGSFVRVNQHLCELMGHAHDDVVAGTYVQFSDAAELEAEAPLVRALLAGEIDGYEVRKRYVRPDGDVRHGLMRVTGIRATDRRVQLLFGVVEDITPRVAAERERDRATEQLRFVLDTSPLGMVLTDESGRVLFANTAEQRLTGRDVSAIDDMLELIHPDDREMLLRKIARDLTTGDLWRVRCRSLHSSGATRWVDITGRVESGGTGRTVVVTADVHDEVLRQQAVEQFQALFATLTDFVAMTDEHGDVQYLNRVGEIYGAALDSDSDDLARFFDAPSRLTLANEGWPEVLEHGFWSGELSIAPAAGLVIPVSLVLVRCATEHGGSFIAAVARDITALKEAQRRLVEQATHDQLTGLPNRRLVLDRIQNALARAERATSGAELALLFVDLDGFKAINDDHGHDAGDEVLVAVGRRLQGLIREGDTVARLGGDEFLLLLDPVGSTDDARHVAERVVAALVQPFDVRGAPAAIGASVGIAMAGAGSGSDIGCEALLKAADLALYDAKRLGKGQVVAYDPARHGRAAA